MSKNNKGSAPRACLGLHSISCPQSTCLSGWRSLSGKVTHSAQFLQVFQSRQKCMRPLKAGMGGTSLAVQWLRLRLPVQGPGSMSDLRAKIPHAERPKYQNRKRKQCYNKFNKDFRGKKNGSHQKKSQKKIKSMDGLPNSNRNQHTNTCLTDVYKCNAGCHPCACCCCC